MASRSSFSNSKFSSAVHPHQRGPDDHLSSDLLIGMSRSSLRAAEEELPSMSTLESTLDSDSYRSWERRALCKPCYAALTFASQKTLRVLFVGMLLAAVHVIGILISVCLLAQRLLDPTIPEKPYLHICTTALFCPLYEVLTGLTAITFQMTASVCGVTINLILVLGALNKISWALLVWLLSYAFAICGCIVLFGTILNTLLIRQSVRRDVHPLTMAVAVVPAVMALLYTICWAMVFSLWRRLKRRQNRVFECVE